VVLAWTVVHGRRPAWASPRCRSAAL